MLAMPFDPALMTCIGATKWIYAGLLTGNNEPVAEEKQKTTDALGLLFPRGSGPCMWDTLRNSITAAEGNDFAVNVYTQYATAIAKLVRQWLGWDEYLNGSVSDFASDFERGLSVGVVLDALQTTSAAYVGVRTHLNRLSFSLAHALSWGRAGFQLKTTRLSRLVKHFFSTCHLLMSAHRLVEWLEWFAALDTRMTEFKLAGIHRKTVLMASLLADFEAYRAWRKSCMRGTPRDPLDLADYLRKGRFVLGREPLKTRMRCAIEQLLAVRTQLMAPDFERLFPSAQPEPTEWVSSDEPRACVICTDAVCIGMRYCDVCKPCPLMHYECFRGYAWEKLRGGHLDKDSKVACPTCRSDFRLGTCVVSARPCDERRRKLPEPSTKRMHVTCTE